MKRFLPLILSSSHPLILSFSQLCNAVLEDGNLQEQVISISNTATANGSGMGDSIVVLAKTHGFTITSDGFDGQLIDQ